MSQPKAKAPKKRKARVWIRWANIYDDFTPDLVYIHSGSRKSALNGRRNATGKLQGRTVRVRITEVLPK